MNVFVQALQERFSTHYIPICIALGAFLFSYNIYNKPNLSYIPTAGFSGVLSYYDGYRYLFCAQRVLQEGYYKFRKGPGFFKVASPTRWTTIVASPEMVEELRMAKSDELSLDQLNEEEFATRYTLGMGASSELYHVSALRGPLTRNLATRFSEVYDEVAQSFKDLIPATDDEWLAVPALHTVQKIVSRTSNRLFLGEPVCRDPEWVDLNIKLTVDVFLRAMVINLFPRSLQPLVGSILSPISHALRISHRLLGAEVAHRLEMEAEYGNTYDDRPNNLISWLLDYAPPEERTVKSILTRLLVVNISAIHTSSTNFYLALLNLAAHPEYAAPMREEVINVVNEHGWTKEALNKMRKVDSFLKESVRFEGMGGLMVQRKVVKKSGYTFANGLHLPFGSYVSVPTYAIHHDLDYYEDPLAFDGFRFSKIREDDGEGLKHQMVSTNPHYLNFGHGKHACPGRFFAVTELKTMLAHLLLNYEVKLESEPKRFWFGIHIAPDERVKVAFRRLKDNH